MRKSIDIDVVPSQVVEIDGALVALELGLEVAEFRKLMDDGRIAVLCERGTGEDLGCHRVTFYYSGRRFRVLIDTAGRIFETT